MPLPKSPENLWKLTLDRNISDHASNLTRRPANPEIASGSREAAWREDRRRFDNGRQTAVIFGAAPSSGVRRN